jgi:hypothetical protein
MADVRNETDDTILKVNELIQKYGELEGAKNNSNNSSGNDGSRAGSGTNTNPTGLGNNKDPSNNRNPNDGGNTELGDGIWWYRDTAITSDGKRYIIASDTKDGTETKRLEVTAKNSSLWEAAENAPSDYTFSFNESELTKEKVDKDPPFEVGDQVASKE